MAMKSQRGSIPWFVVALETEIRGFQRRHTFNDIATMILQDTYSAAQGVASFLEYFGLRHIRQQASAVATPHPREHKKTFRAESLNCGQALIPQFSHIEFI